MIKKLSFLLSVWLLAGSVAPLTVMAAPHIPDHTDWNVSLNGEYFFNGTHVGKLFATLYFNTNDNVLPQQTADCRLINGCAHYVPAPLYQDKFYVDLYWQFNENAPGDFRNSWTDDVRYDVTDFYVAWEGYQDRQLVILASHDRPNDGGQDVIRFDFSQPYVGYWAYDDFEAVLLGRNDLVNSENYVYDICSEPGDKLEYCQFHGVPEGFPDGRTIGDVRYASYAQPSSVTEPPAFTLLSLSLAGLALIRRRKHQSTNP